MPLTEQEKNGLTAQLVALLEANEPEAMVAVLGRVADKMARRVIRASISNQEALRWQSLAQACASVEKELANAPRSRLDPSVSWNDEGLDGIERRKPQSAPSTAESSDETPSAT